MLVGLLIGMLSSYFEGPFDWFFNIIASIFQGIPDLCFLVALAGILGGGIGTVLIGLVLKFWVGFSRIVRSEVMKLRRESYVYQTGVLRLAHSQHRYNQTGKTVSA